MQDNQSVIKLHKKFGFEIDLDKSSDIHNNKKNLIHLQLYYDKWKLIKTKFEKKFLNL